MSLINNIIFIVIFFKICLKNINSNCIYYDNNNKYICDKLGGICVKNTCICQYGYVTNNKQVNNAYYFTNINLNSTKLSSIDIYSDNVNLIRLCSYKQLSAFKAGMYELLLGFGIGHFSVRRNYNGTIKLLIYAIITILCVFNSIILINNKRNTNISNNLNYKGFYMLFLIIKILVILWQLFDFFLFIFYYYKDGNNIDLV